MRSAERLVARRSAARSGFTLIELVVVLAILAMLAGAAIPVTSKILTYKARKATREELQLLSDATVEYFRDTKAFPTSVGNLLTSPSLTGWTGPYLPGVVTDQVTGAVGYEVDAWSRAYVFSRSGDVVTIRSKGPNGASGDSDDVTILVDVTFVRREETVAELRLLNQAITHYNDAYLATAPLSATWSTAFTTLVAKGFLPNDSDYRTDGWGAAYVGSVPGVSPLVELVSPSMSD